MPKKESKPKDGNEKSRNWSPILAAAIVLILVIVIFANDFSSGTGSAIRVSGSKKPDLVAAVNLQDDVERKFAENGTLLYYLQVGAGLANFGNARSKESVFRIGVKGDNLENVGVTVSYLDATGQLVLSATTKFITITNYYGTYVDINIDPLVPLGSPGKSSDVYTVLFMRVPINTPPPDGTVSETKLTFYGQADVTSVVRESDETNNYKENSYIFRCAYLNYTTIVPYPSCCIHRVDPTSTTYTSIRGNYCEDYHPYSVLYLPP